MLENAKLTTLQATQNLELSRTQLFNAVSSGDDGQTLDPPKLSPLALQPLETLIQTALSQRVDVQKAISRVGDVEDALNVATRSRLLPSGSLGANIAVFDPNADAKIRSASLSFDPSRKALESTRQAAVLDLRRKYADAPLLQRRYPYQQQVLSKAVRALETAKKRLAVGSITALEVTQAQQTVSQAQRDLENQLGTLNLSAIRLENASGSYKGESR